MHELNPTQIAQRLDQLTELSVALGDSPDIGSLLDRIPRVAKHMTNADVGAGAANSRQPVNIEDVYQAEDFNFSGMRAFDIAFGYRTRSIPSVPVDEASIPGYTP